MRRALSWTLVALLAAALAGFIWAWRQAAPAPYHPGRPTDPVLLRATDPARAGAAPVDRFEFTGPGGDRIPCIACIPGGAGGRPPAVVFLYGIGMSMRDIAPVAPLFAQAGFALFCPEQLMRGERRIHASSPVLDLLRFNRRVCQTGHELRALLDAIVGADLVDPSRIYFWGASFGAIVAAGDAAADARVRAAVFTLAGGALARLVEESPMRTRASAGQLRLARGLAAAFAPLDPVRHVGRFAPRPLLFQNTERDDILPRSCAEALHAAAREPKQIRWYPFSHNHLGRAEVETMVRDGIGWLKRADEAIKPLERTAP